MASIYIADRVKEQCQGSGLSNLSLLGAVDGYKSYVDSMPMGAKTLYCVLDGTEWEIGEGTLVPGPQISRDTVRNSSTSTGRVNNNEAGSPERLVLSSGTHIVFCGPFVGDTILRDPVSGALTDPSPFRATVFVPTIAAMKAQTGVANGEAMFVLGGSAVGDGSGGVFWFDASDVSAPDNVDTFRNDNATTGLHKRVNTREEALVGGLDVEQRLALLEYTPPTLSGVAIGGSAALVVELGTTQSNLSLVWTLSRSPTSLLVAGSAVTNTLRSQTQAGPYSSDQTFTVAFSDNKPGGGAVTGSATATLTFRRKRFWGVSSNATLTGAQVRALSGSDLLTGKAKSVTYDCSAGNQYAYFCVPVSEGQPTPQALGSDLTPVVATVAVNDASGGNAGNYYVCRLTDPQNSAALAINWV